MIASDQNKYMCRVHFQAAMGAKLNYMHVGACLQCFTTRSETAMQAITLHGLGQYSHTCACISRSRSRNISAAQRATMLEICHQTFLAQMASAKA